jgi:hypothetical protein
LGVPSIRNPPNPRAFCVYLYPIPQFGSDGKRVLPLDALAPGTYRLRAVAGWPIETPAATREVDFTVLEPSAESISWSRGRR